jgi:hypothetical protein
MTVIERAIKSFFLVSAAADSEFSEFSRLPAPNRIPLSLTAWNFRGQRRGGHRGSDGRGRSNTISGARGQAGDVTTAESSEGKAPPGGEEVGEAPRKKS